MGLAGFNRARRRSIEEGAGQVLASAPKTNYVKGKYVKQDETEKQYCAFCDKRFNNTAAYEAHMQLKHTKYYIENNPGCVITAAMQKKLEQEE